MQSANSLQRTTFNPAQLELLEMMSHVKSPETLNELRDVIVQFFAKKIEKEIDDMWDKGMLSEEKVEGFRNLHERTPYKQ